MKRIFITILLSWIAFTAVTSIRKVRAILAAPLVVTDESAHGDACYVLASGNAIWERLAAASDLYLMRRVSKIFIMRNGEPSSYNFDLQTNWSQTQWAVSYLAWQGIPKERVIILDEVKGPLGTLCEAKNLARTLPLEVKRLVLVTSAPHTRRSLFTFRKLLPASVTVIPYAATPLEYSTELTEPIWLEYLKLLVYHAYLLI
jgi:uncharacterized SAM-binding protein YcdF (DUF218 family)